MRSVNPLGHLSLALILGGILLHSACGGSKASPTGPSPLPTATPTPGSSNPVPPAAAGACASLEKVTQKSACNVASATLTDQVSSAIERVIASRADLFDEGKNERGDPHIKNQKGYYEAVIAELDSAGYCAARVSPTDLDIHVTNSYHSSDRFQIMTGYSYPWRGKASYVESCMPAAIPKAEINSVDWVYVTAYGVQCPAGVTLTNPFIRGNRAEMPLECEIAITATPKTWGGLDVPLSVSGDSVEWIHESGEFVFWVWPDQPYNVTLSPRGTGPAKLCAKVSGVIGCLDGAIVP
jgi:hypothetical protein